MKRVNEGRRRDGERKGQIGTYNLGGRDVIGLSGGRKVVFQGDLWKLANKIFSKRYLREKKGIKKSNKIIQKRVRGS